MMDEQGERPSWAGPVTSALGQRVVVALALIDAGVLLLGHEEAADRPSSRGDQRTRAALALDALRVVRLDRGQHQLGLLHRGVHLDILAAGQPVYGAGLDAVHQDLVVRTPVSYTHLRAHETRH